MIYCKSKLESLNHALLLCLLRYLVTQFLLRHDLFCNFSSFAPYDTEKPKDEHKEYLVLHRILLLLLLSFFSFLRKRKLKLGIIIWGGHNKRLSNHDPTSRILHLSLSFSYCSSKLNFNFNTNMRSHAQ